MNHKERHPCRERSLGVIGGLAALLALTAGPAMESAKAADAQPSWMKDAALVAAARKEGEVTLISSLAEEVALPQLHIFEDATGIKTNSVRGQNGSIMSRITIENRANKQTWDTVELQVVDSLPKEWLSKFKPTEAAALVPDAKDPDDHWFGIYAVFNTPAYNTNLVKRDQLPKSYEDLAKRADWAGHVAVLDDDRGWLAGLLAITASRRVASWSRTSSTRSIRRFSRGIWRSPARWARVNIGWRSTMPSISRWSSARRAIPRISGSSIPS
jgi:hypothetical protein